MIGWLIKVTYDLFSLLLTYLWLGWRHCPVINIIIIRFKITEQCRYLFFSFFLKIVLEYVNFKGLLIQTAWIADTSHLFYH